MAYYGSISRFNYVFNDGDLNKAQMTTIKIEYKRFLNVVIIQSREKRVWEWKISLATKNKWINKDRSKVRIGHHYFCGRGKYKRINTVHMLIAEPNWNRASCPSAMNCFVHNFIIT